MIEGKVRYDVLERFWVVGLGVLVGIACAALSVALHGWIKVFMVLLALVVTFVAGIVFAEHEAQAAAARVQDDSAGDIQSPLLEPASKSLKAPRG